MFAFTTDAIDDDAVETALTVLALTTAAIELDAASSSAEDTVSSPDIAEFVLLLTVAATELEAVCTSLCVAREPELKPAPVSVRVAEAHTSVTRVPNEVRVRPLKAQTSAGIEAIDVTMDEMRAPSDEDAAVTMVLVLAFTTAAIEDEAVCNSASDTASMPAIAVPRDEEAALVVPLTTAAIELEAVATIALVFAFTTAAIEEDAACRSESVRPLPPLAFISATIELDAVCTSLCVASEPEVKPAPVSVRVAEAHTSVTRVPKLLRVRDV